MGPHSPLESGVFLGRCAQGYPPQAAPPPHPPLSEGGDSRKTQGYWHSAPAIVWGMMHHCKAQQRHISPTIGGAECQKTMLFCTPKSWGNEVPLHLVVGKPSPDYWRGGALVSHTADSQGNEVLLCFAPSWEAASFLVLHSHFIAGHCGSAEVGQRNGYVGTFSPHMAASHSRWGGRASRCHLPPKANIQGICPPYHPQVSHCQETFPNRTISEPELAYAQGMMW